MAAHAQATQGVTNADIARIRYTALRKAEGFDGYRAAVLRLKSDNVEGGRVGWPEGRVKSPIPPYDVQIYCNQDAKWQAVRLAMKGLTTMEKLVILDWWWNTQCVASKCANDVWRLQVQTSNYITALRRGGFLTTDDWIKK